MSTGRVTSNEESYKENRYGSQSMHKYNIITSKHLIICEVVFFGPDSDTQIGDKTYETHLIKIICVDENDLGRTRTDYF